MGRSKRFGDMKWELIDLDFIEPRFARTETVQGRSGQVKMKEG